MEAFVSAGAAAAETPAGLAARSEVIMICVSDTPDVEQVLLGENGVLEGVRPGSLVIDHSTISPRATVRMAAALAGRGAHMLDAPVSGGSEGAEKGTLSIMVGGEGAQFERALPYFKSIGRAITHVGPSGSGQMTKLVNQILVVVNELAVSEALLFAQAGGIDPATALSAVRDGAAGSWMLANRGPQMIARDWRPGFTIDLQQKDLRLVLEAADQLGIPLPGTGLVFQLYRALQNRGLGAEGNHALVKALEALSGIELGRQEASAGSGAA
jgi:3-hydroxyisobutyrate dehydrogenase